MLPKRSLLQLSPFDSGALGRVVSRIVRLAVCGVVQKGDSPPDCVIDSATPLLQHGTTARSDPISPVFLELETLEISFGPAKACAPVARARQITVLYEGRMVMNLKLVLALFFCCIFI